jgi:SAM-dependent methyltransferase
MVPLVLDQTVAIAQLQELLDDEPPQIIEEISRADGMYSYAPHLYAVAGRQGLRSIRLAMLAAELESPRTILDFACGAGRVLRYLTAAFPDAAFTACDVRPEHVEFCSRVFGVTGLLSRPDPDEIELEGPYDVIWCGSLFTHVDERLWRRFLALLGSVLAPGGVLVFTVYGRDATGLIRSGENRLDLTERQAEEVVRAYDEIGFGFGVATGRPEEGFGDCIASRAWVCTQLEQIVPDLSLLLYMEQAWIKQDVVACTRSMTQVAA